MFLGTHSPRLDEKGRLILPAKFREELADGLVLTRGQERCLYVFSAAEFERVHEQMRAAPLSSKQARDYIRVFLSGASDEVPDKQGRVTVPVPLRQYAGLDRELAVVGAGLYLLGKRFGFANLAFLYFVPYLVVNAWLVTITLLQHTHPALPHYRSESW